MLEPIYMIAQTLAALALFATLVVIALQNRQQARISRSQVNQAATDRWREYFAILRRPLGGVNCGRALRRSWVKPIVKRSTRDWRSRRPCLRPGPTSRPGRPLTKI